MNEFEPGPETRAAMAAGPAASFTTVDELMADLMDESPQTATRKTISVQPAPPATGKKACRNPGNCCRAAAKKAARTQSGATTA